MGLRNTTRSSVQGRVRRRFATVLAADVASYSAMVAQSEEETIRSLKAARSVFDQRIEDHNGRIANTAGDSIIAVFDSPVEAVRCALEVQTRLKSKNYSRKSKATQKTEPNVVFRIGVHMGDVLLDGNDVLGDVVNTAARLESIASPGAVCISSIVREQIGNRLSDYPITDLGDKALKNLPNPVRAFEFLSPKGVGVKTSNGATQSPHKFLVLVAACFIVLGSVTLGVMAARSLLFAAQSDQAFRMHLEQSIPAENSQ